MLKFIKSCGYRVFYVPGREYCFYSDGTRIGYAQWSGYESTVSTVHVPCRHAGTGYRVADEITSKTLKQGLSYKPSWAIGDAPVQKYKSLNEFISGYWNKELIEFEPTSYTGSTDEPIARTTTRD